MDDNFVDADTSVRWKPSIAEKACGCIVLSNDSGCDRIQVLWRSLAWDDGFGHDAKAFGYDPSGFTNLRNFRFVFKVNQALTPLVIWAKTSSLD